MVWSNWRGAVLVMLAWVGLAWSQAPMPTSSVNTAERIMTVHEDGRSVRCRVVSTWRTPEGATAYQLQVLDTGEMMTIVEDGPAATIHEPWATKVKALPMRIFHWGRNRVPPAGVPVPPDTYIAAGSSRGGAGCACDQCQNGSSRVASGTCDQCQVGSSRVASGPTRMVPGSKDEVVWWEEKNGQRVSPTIVTSGKNPFEQPMIMPAPGAGTPLPVIVDQRGNPVAPGQAGVPMVVDPRPPVAVKTQPQQNPKTTPGVVQTVPGMPATTQTIPASGEPTIRPQTPYVQVGPTPLPNRIKATVAGQTQSPNNTTVTQPPALQADPTRPANPANPASIGKNSVKPAVTVAQNSPPLLPTLPSATTNNQEPRAQVDPNVTPPSQNNVRDPAKTNVAPVQPTRPAPRPTGVATNPATAGATMPQTQGDPSVRPSIVAAPAATSGTVAGTTKPPVAVAQKTASTDAKEPTTNAAAAANTQPPPTVAKAPPRLTLGQKIHNWLNPKEDTIAGQPKKAAGTDKVAAADKAAGAEKLKEAVGVANTTKAAQTAPFSTAAGSGANVKNTPPLGDNSKALSIASATNPGTGTAASDKADDKAPIVQVPPKKDWRTMWGQPKEAKAQVPGKSMIEQASAKPDPKAVPLIQIPSGMPATLPPTSMVEKKQSDILLNPEKFDPDGSRMAPKGINMNSYRGDPTKSLQQAQAPVVQPVAAQIPPGQTAVQPPPLPPYNGRLPLGAQSVLAANNNVPSRITYVPVPVATVPDPFRPPQPPAAKLPEPPQPTAYLNAFSPAAQPQEKPPQNPMTVNAFSNMNPPANPNGLAQGYPFPVHGPNPYLPNPMAQGYPMVPMGAPNQNMMAAQGAPNPYYYGPQGPAPQMPMSPQGYPLAQTNYPQNYQGPQAPNPYAPQMQQMPQQPLQPIQYSPLPNQQQMVNQAMERRQVSGPLVSSPELLQVIKVLRESPYPAQREWASNTMATYDWRAHPEVVQVLLQGAQQDPAATVRASCVYSLGRMNAASEPVVSILYTLRNDGDPRVRQEVEQALVRLGVNRQ